MIGAGLAGLGLVGAGYAGLAGKDDTTRDESGEVVEGGELGAFRIRLGDCFGDIPTGTFESVHAVPCADPHRYEVFAAFMLPQGAADPYPGAPTLEAAAGDGCLARFEPFVGLAYGSSRYEIGTITPTPTSWDQVDDREVLCLIARVDHAPTTGSARGTAV